MVNYLAVLLGAGRPFKGVEHSVLGNSGDETIVLDWILDALLANMISDIQFIGGYRIEGVKKKYPSLQFKEKSDWNSSKSCGSFFIADLDPAAGAIVSYVDIVYRPELIKLMSTVDSDVVVAIDSKWLSRYAERSKEELTAKEKVCIARPFLSKLGGDIDTDLASGEFLGVVQFAPPVVSFLMHLDGATKQKFNSLRLSDLVEFLRIKGFSIGFIDILGDWAELNDPRDLAQFILGTKAETLSRLQSLVTKSEILDQVTFTSGAWQSEYLEILAGIEKKFHADNVIVRSSAIAEDSFYASNAGAFTSLLDINPNKINELRSAIDNVIGSYPDNLMMNQVLVQPMVRKLRISGVVFSRTLEQVGPYFVVNYDDISRTSDSITSGSSSNHKTIKVLRNAADHLNLPEDIRSLLAAVLEIEGLLGLDNLDIEFAITDDAVVYILQVRPVVANKTISNEEDEKVFAAIRKAKEAFKRFQSPSPFTVGKRSVFGSMPDWNPAEIIGQRPNRLAYDIYNHQIMAESWAIQRKEYGYRDVRPLGLMKNFIGQPYVDIRASFNSFIPVDIADSLAERLVDFFINWLEMHPDSHDKVEFDVLPTCFSLTVDFWKNRLVESGGISECEFQEYWEALRLLTSKAIKGVHNAFKDIDALIVRYEVISKLDMDPLCKASVLLDDSRRYGTVAFSHLARDAFVAMTLLKSGVNSGFLTDDGLNSFLRSIRSVAHDFTEDAGKVKQDEMARSDFYTKYGHLRPNTYNICSARYSSNPGFYLEPSVQGYSTIDKENNNQQWDLEKNIFFETLIGHGLADNGEEIESFLRRSIEGREYAKFVFTKNISDALELLVEFSDTVGLERAELAKTAFAVNS